MLTRLPYSKTMPNEARQKRFKAICLELNHLVAAHGYRNAICRVKIELPPEAYDDFVDGKQRITTIHGISVRRGYEV
jgi:hypothetical protein